MMLGGPRTDPPVSVFDGVEAVEKLYRERAHLVAHLAAYYPSAAGYTDPAAADWLVVSIETPEGQMCWHIAKRDEDLFEHVPRVDTLPWDGHTTEEKYRRVAEGTERLAEQRRKNEEGW